MVRPMRRGFSLVGIMIVGAIIGVLVAIAVPGFLKARKQIRLAAFQEDQAKIDGADELHILEWKNVLVGPDKYLRGEPKCPGGGLYLVFASDAMTFAMAEGTLTAFARSAPRVVARIPRDRQSFDSLTAVP